MDTLAKRVKAARMRLDGMRQEDLAIASGLKQGDISKIENGKILKTTGTVALARALRVDPHWLATGEGSMTAGTGWPGTRFTLEQIHAWPPEVLEKVEDFALGVLAGRESLPTTVHKPSDNKFTVDATGAISMQLSSETKQGQRHGSSNPVPTLKRSKGSQG